MKKIIASFLLSVTLVTAHAAIVGKDVSYKSGDTEMKGYLVYDDANAKPRPGVLVVHEWWGHNEHARERARMLAKAGYVALAVDMYGDGKTANHPKDAGGFAGAVRNNMPLARARFEAAMATLQDDPHTDKTKIAAIGFCFGGSVVLEMARMGLDLKGVASFHGGLGTDQPAKKGAMKAQVLVLTGEDDPMVKADSVATFKKEMKDAGVKFDVVSYKGVKHSFTNPDADRIAKEFDMPVGYDAKADKDSWKRLEKFLKKVFK